MLCKSPFVKDPTGRVFKASLLTGDRDLAVAGIPFPCGQCLPCRINKRRLWTHRLMLESYAHSSSIFVTLTYDPEHLPLGGTLVKKDLQLFFKRLRYYVSSSVGSQKLRYYACGEYGPQTCRPHYHAIIFGLSVLDRPIVEASWSFGLCHVGECNRHSIQYVAGYVTKKFIKKDDPYGRQQEFVLMSRRPGLGTDSICRLYELISDPKFAHLFQGDSAIPDGLRHGNILLPFDRFIKHKLIKMLDHDPGIADFVREMHRKYLEAVHSGLYKEDYLSSILIDESKQRNVQIERRFKLFNQRTAL